MNLHINIPFNGLVYSYPLLSCRDYQRIELVGVVIFDVWKVHNHRYDLKAFFYRSKTIVGERSFVTKKELFDVMQKLLQQFL